MAEPERAAAQGRRSRDATGLAAGSSGTRTSSTGRSNGTRFAARALPPIVLCAVLVGVWDLWIRVRHVDPAVFPTPARVVRALGAQASTLRGHIPTTMAETGIGLVVGVAIGLAIAVLCASVPLARRAIEPLLVVAQTVPAVVLAPILVLAFGFGWTPRVIVVVLVVLFPVTVAATGAFTSADDARVDLVRSFGASRRQVLGAVVVPGALPAIFDGVRISAAYAVGTAAVAEQIGGARGGLGLFIARSQRSFRSDQVMAAVVVIAALSLAVYGLVGLVARWAMPWRASEESGVTA